MSSLNDAVTDMDDILKTCVWSKGQTHAGLVPYLIEESYELVEAIETGTRDDMIEELGDVLWQVLFHAGLAERDGGTESFDLEDVAARLHHKMVTRHPHVFAGATAETPEEVLRLWAEAKALEKHERTSVLDGIPRSLPALALADKLLGKAASLGISDTADETSETDETGAAGESSRTNFTSREGSASVTHDGIHDGGVIAAGFAGVRQPQTPFDEDSLGDQLLALVVAARAQGFNAETALRARLRRLEQTIRAAEVGRGAGSSAETEPQAATP